MVDNFDFLEAQFLTAKEAEGKSSATITFYRENLIRIRWWLATTGKPLVIPQITPYILRELLVYVRTATNRWGIGSTSAQKPASISTVDAYWRTLQAFFAWLVKEGIVAADTNPMNKLPRVTLPHIIKQDIPLPLIKKAVEHRGQTRFITIRNKAIVLFFLDTGIRLGACWGLGLSDVNTETGVARVWEKGHRQVLVHLNETALTALKEYIEIRKHITSEALWVCENGAPMAYASIQIMIRRLGKYTGDARWTPHAFRNTFALNLLRAGADTFSLQILGGWKDLEMPKHYTEAMRVEDAIRVHQRTSPADRLAGVTDNKR